MRVRLALIGLGALLPVLAGCGSGASPPFTVACKTHHLRPGVLRVAVTVTNTTSKTGNATVYGPIFAHIQRVYPSTMIPQYVTVQHAHGSASYSGFLVSHIRPTHPRHVFFRFSAPHRPEHIVATNVLTVPDTGTDPLNNPDCVI